MVAIYERPDTGEFENDPPQYVGRWNIDGVVDSGSAYALAVGGTPTTVGTAAGTLRRSNVKVGPRAAGGGLWLADVLYTPRKNDVGESTFGFDTTGATVHVKAALEHIHDYNHPDNPFPVNNYRGAIQVSKDGKTVEGCDLVTPALRLTYTYKHSQGFVDELYAKLLASITGTTNSQKFRTFEPGELLFLGASGLDGTNAEASVVFNFLASSNQSSLTIGEITGIVKEGHHFLWIEFADAVSSGSPIVKPTAVHIEKVYPAVNFPDYFGWS